MVLVLLTKLRLTRTLFMRSIISLILFILPLLGWAQSAPSNNTHEYKLANGLKLIVRVDKRAPVVFTSVWYRVGSSYEHSGITGISHVLEHMMFRGTKDVGPGQFAKIISDNGGRQNAMTSSDFTVYFQRMPADKLAVSFRLEADRMRHLTIDPQAFVKELKVVMEERRMRVDDNPQGLLYERFQASAFVNNPYHNPTIGWMTDLQNLKRQDLVDWYRMWYAPNNATVIVVGDVNPQHVLELAKKYFGPLKPEKIKPLKPRREVDSVGIRRVDVQASAKLPTIMLGFNVPSTTTSKESWQAYALVVAAAILDSGQSSRIPKELIRGRQVAAGAETDYDVYALHNTLFVLSGVPANQHTVKDLKKALLAEVDNLKSKPISLGELSRVKAQVVAQNVFGKDSMMGQAMQIGTPEMVGLSWRESAAFVQRIEAVTPQQVQAVAKMYFTPQRLTVAILHPLNGNGEATHE